MEVNIHDMGDFNIFKFCVTTITFMMLQCEGSFLTFDDLVLCDQSSIGIMCPNETLIREVNITFPILKPSNNVCPISNYDTDNIWHNQTSLDICVGKQSCNISSTDVDFSQLVGQTWKLHISFTCDRTNGNTNPRNPQIICPEKVTNVKCNDNSRKINIKSAFPDTGESICKTRDASWCADIVKKRIKSICDRKQSCGLIDETPAVDWDSCIMVPKYAFVSFACFADEHVINNINSDGNQVLDKTLSVVVGVLLGLVMIGIIGAVYAFLRRNNKPKKQAYLENDVQDYVGQQGIAFHSGDNFVLPSGETQIPKRDQNRLQSSIGHGTDQTLRCDVYEFAEVSGLDIGDGQQYNELENKTEYANMPETKQIFKDIESSKQYKNSTLEEDTNYMVDGNIYERNSDYDKIVRGDKHRDDELGKFMDENHVYSHTVDGEYDTAQIVEGIPRNQNYDHVFLED